MRPNNLLLLSTEMYEYFEHAQSYVVIAFTCYSYKTDNDEIS
jgi:hypothetical protein